MHHRLHAGPSLLHLLNKCCSLRGNARLAQNAEHALTCSLVDQPPVVVLMNRSEHVACESLLERHFQRWQSAGFFPSIDPGTANDTAWLAAVRAANDGVSTAAFNQTFCELGAYGSPARPARGYRAMHLVPPS